MKFISLVMIIFVLMVVFSGCTAGPNQLEKTPNPKGKTAGFFYGLWHGFIAPVTFIISIFTKSVHFYEVHNNGTWYNFGFVLGAGLFLGGGIMGRKSTK